MKFSKRYVAESDLLTFINKQYAIKGERIRLYRTSQGQVFFIQSSSGRKAFKLYLQQSRMLPSKRHGLYRIWMVAVIPS